MALARDIAHRTLRNPVMPYVTFSSPTSREPQVFSGNNILTSVQQIMEKYPGFAAGIEAIPQIAAATAKVVRVFAWKKWDTTSTTGSHYWMKCETDTTNRTSKVYKLEVGVDANFILIHTDSTSSQPFDFIAANNTCFFGNGTSATNMRAFDGISGSSAARRWGIVAPAAALTIGALAGTGITAYTGYVYFYTYYNSSNSHESSPSPVSACTGLFTNNYVPVTVVASGDSQVNQIRIYRSTDGGSKAPQDAAEITGSPFTNANQTINDATNDADLSATRFAPAALANDPPTPSTGFTIFANRIWSKASNRVYFSGFEEITNGVNEEAWPSGGDGNSYPYPNQVNGLAGLDSLVVVATADALYGIDGDSLDTFRRYTVSARNGVKSSTNIAVVSLEPGTVLAAWLDANGELWMLGRGEIGLPIRPDLASIDQTKSSLCFHINGLRRWLVLADPTGGRIFTYDLDTGIWMPPRLVTAHAVHGGETSTGTWDLVIGHDSRKVLKMTEGTYNDNGVVYGSSLTTNLFDMTPEANPNWRGVCDWIAVEGDTKQPDSVKIVTDDDPRSTIFTASGAGVNADLRTQGSDMLEKYYKFNTPAARRVAFQLDWQPADENFRVYGIDIAYRPVGG